MRDLIHGGRGNDEVDGGAGDGDRVIGDLGDDKVLGGAGAGDEVAGDLGIDIVNGGAGNEDLVHGDYGWDRMSGGAGKGDIASFATDVAAAKGAGVWASLAKHRAFGDGHDKLFGFESLEGSAFRDTLIGNKQANVIDGGPGDDHLIGGGGPDALDGGQGKDGCEGAKGGTVSCGKEKAPAGLGLRPARSPRRRRRRPADRRRRRPRRLHRRLRRDRQHLQRHRGEAAGDRPRLHPPAATCASEVSCPAGGPGRWLMADLGPGNDKLQVEGSLLAVGSVRFAGGLGNDTIHGGPEDDLIEAGPGADKLYGGAGADGLVGGLPGPTYLYGEGNGDLLAAGGGCAGGALVGGPGRDDASFAETQAHPGLLIISFPKHSAWIDEIKGCDSVHLSPHQRGHGGLLRLGRPDRRRPRQQHARPARRRRLHRQRRRRRDRRPRRRPRLRDPVRQRQAAALKKKNGKGMTKGSGQAAGRALTDPFDPEPVQLLDRQTRHPRPRPQRLT